jgi:hypothetical protein
MGAMRGATISSATAVLACVATACGGSSGAATNVGSGASSAPSRDGSATRALTAGGATDSEPISSPAYRKLIATAVAGKGLSPPIAAKVADCIVKQEAAQGYRTVADVARDATSRQRAIQDAEVCTAQALPAG